MRSSLDTRVGNDNLFPLARVRARACVCAFTSPCRDDEHVAFFFDSRNEIVDGENGNERDAAPVRFSIIVRPKKREEEIPVLGYIGDSRRTVFDESSSLRTWFGVLQPRSPHRSLDESQWI